MCSTWQLSVPLNGLTYSDQRQPGSKVPRPIMFPFKSTSSTLPFPSLNSRTSSADSKPLPLISAIVSPFADSQMRWTLSPSVHQTEKRGLLESQCPEARAAPAARFAGADVRRRLVEVEIAATLGPISEGEEDQRADEPGSAIMAADGCAAPHHC